MDTMQDEATDLLDTAAAFFHACESGEGWEACKQYCHPADRPPQCPLRGVPARIPITNERHVSALAGVVL
jgi:hypothetical protein